MLSGIPARAGMQGKGSVDLGGRDSVKGLMEESDGGAAFDLGKDATAGKQAAEAGGVGKVSHGLENVST